MKRRYRKQCQVQFVDAVVMMANALQAGLNLQQAVELVASEGPSPLRIEFDRAVTATSLGMRFETAIAGLTERIGGEDAAYLRFAVFVLRESGGDLIRTFQRLATTIQERERVRGRIRSLTTQGMVSGVVIAAMPLVLCAGMALIMPHFIAPLFTTWLGRTLLCAALVLQGLGLLWMRTIVRVKV